MSNLSRVLTNPIAFFVYSLLCSILLVNQYYFPFAGWAMVGITAISYIMLAKSKLNVFDWIFALIAVLSASMYLIYSSGMIMSFAFLVYIYAGSWLLTKSPTKNLLKIFHLFFPFVFAFLQVWTTNAKLLNDPKSTNTESNTKPNSIWNKTKKAIDNSPKLILNILISVLVLVLIVPLLSYSNPYFGQFVGDFFSNIWNQIKDIFSVWTILRAIIFVYVSFGLPRLFNYCQKPNSEDSFDTFEFDLSITKFTVVITLLGFFIAQIQTYFNPNLLNTTAGKMANEIFFHLSVVCLVVFVLLYINLKNKVIAKVSSLILLIQSAFLGFIAFNSDWFYVTTAGLTHKRLYGFGVLLFVFSVIAIFIFELNKKNSKLSQSLALVFCVVFGLTNAINFDRLIYNNPPTESWQGSSRVEKNYVSTMALESYSLEKEFAVQSEAFLRQRKTHKWDYSCANLGWLRMNYRQVEYLQNKYKSPQILSFNWTQWSNYLRIKDIKLFDQKFLDEVNYYDSKSTPKPVIEDCYRQFD